MWNGNEATKMRQPDFPLSLLPERSIVKVGGPDAKPFLHNLLTADIEPMVEGDAVYGALLTPQGKILFDMFLFFDGHTFLIDCAKSQKQALLTRLNMYKLRANVLFGEGNDLEAGVSPRETIHALRYRDPRLKDMGWRIMVPESRLKHEPGYHAQRIELGLADSDADLGSGAYFPHEANLDQLNGVSFTKGCYVGQEVVSRMEHRGTARSRILPVMLNGDPPSDTSEIRSGDKMIGTLLSSAGRRALALIRLDRLGEATEPLLTNAVTVSVLKPRWARYDVLNAKGTA